MSTTYDYSLIEISQTEDGSNRVYADLFVETYWGPTPTPEVTDPAVLALLAAPFTAEGVAPLQQAYGDALLALLPATAPPVVTEDVLAEEPPAPAPFAVDSDEAFYERRRIVESMQFALHSAVRSGRNRTLRAKAPTPHRFKQYVTTAQLRLLRGRPVPLSGESVIAHLEELRGKEATGILEVRTLHGQCLLNLETLHIAPSALAPPLPNRLPDSATRDPNGGEFIPPFDGALPVPPPSEASEVSVGGIPPTITVQQKQEQAKQKPKKKER